MVWTKSRALMLTPFEVTVADDSGVEVAIFGGSTFHGSKVLSMGPLFPAVQAQVSNVTLAGWPSKPLPHHAREIGLAFYDRSGRVGYFKVPNPAYRRVRTGRPESLPLIKTAGDMQVKLSRVDITKDPDNPSRVDWAVSAEVLRNGAPHPDWKMEGIDVLSGGEVLAQTAPAWFPLGLRDRQDDTTTVHPFPGLWPDTVWTLCLWAVQYTNFTPDQVWILKDISLTNTVELKRENSKRRLSRGKTVEFRGFNGPERNDGAAGFISGKTRNVTVYFKAPPADEGVRITFLRGCDDRGRTLDSPYGMPVAPFKTWPTPDEPHNWVYGIGLRPEPDAKSLTLEFAAHKTRSVDFVVKANFAK
jgi:hypothetical protein